MGSILCSHAHGEGAGTIFTKKHRVALTLKSRLEERVLKLLPASTKYEPDRIKYLVEHHYKPDFRIRKNTYIEAKGLFLPEDRAKHLHIQKQHPEVKVYFLFQDSNKKLNRASKTTYAMWCEKNGFEYTDIKSVEKNPAILEAWLQPNKD